MAIHRVVPNFVLQDGDPTGTGNGGPGYEIRRRVEPAVATSAGPSAWLSAPTGGSQWFVTHSPQPHLNGLCTVFGRVVNGQDVVERVEQWDRILRVTIAGRSREPGPEGRHNAVPGAARILQLLGLVVSGAGFFSGVIGGNVRLELVLLAVGAAIFFLGRLIQNRR